MASVTTHDFLSCRVYDGAGHYINVTQYGYFTVPGSRAIPATEPIAGGGKVAEGNIAYIVRDQLPMLTPIEWSLTINIEQDKLWQLDAFANPRRKTGAWEIGSTATVWSPVTTLGTVPDIFGNNVTLPLPIHALHTNYLVNFEAFLAVPSSAPAGVPYVHRMLGNGANGYDFVTQQGELQFTINMVCFGQVDSLASAFSDGTETV